MRWLRRHRLLIGAGSLVLAGVVVATVHLWPAEDEPAPRARVYRDYDVCVLTGGRGLADPQAAAVWAGVQQVSTSRSVRVLYFPVAGPQTVERAGEFLGSLVQQDCEVIVAVGEAPAAAVAANESRFPEARIVAVGDEIDGSSTGAVKASTVDVVLKLVPFE